MFSHWFLKLNIFTSFLPSLLHTVNPKWKFVTLLHPLWRKIRICSKRAWRICSYTEHSSLCLFQEKVHILWYAILQNLLNLASAFSPVSSVSIFVVHEALVRPQGFTHIVLNIWTVVFNSSTSTSFSWLIYAGLLGLISGVISLRSHLSPKLPILLHDVHRSFYMLLNIEWVLHNSTA